MVVHQGGGSNEEDKNDADQIVRFGIKFAKSGNLLSASQNELLRFPTFKRKFVNYLWVEGKI